MMDNLLLPPTEQRAPRSTIMSVADPMPAGVDWFPHGVVLPQLPTGHVRVSMQEAIVAPGDPTKQTNICDGARFFPFAMDWDTELVGMAAATKNAKDTARQLSEHSLAADEAYGMSLALQMGVTSTNFGSTPGFTTISADPLQAEHVKTLTSAGVEADPLNALVGGALPLEQGIALALDWWRVAGQPGMCLLHLPAQLAPMCAMKRLIEVGQQGPVLLAGGLAYMSFGPGYDPQVGPGALPSTVAPAGTAWMWVTGRVYAEIGNAETLSATDEFLNRSMSRAQKFGIYAFNTSTVAAVLVSVS